MHIKAKHTRSLRGTVIAPASKSQAVRALLFALLSPGTSIIRGYSEGEDVQHAIQAVIAMGAAIEIEGRTLKVKSQGMPFQVSQSDIYTGNSGITTHFLLPLLGYRNDPQIPVALNCGDQLRLRPMQSLIEALRTLGMHIDCLEKENSLPAHITGSLHGGKVSVSGVSSQYLSALLMALPLALEDSEITVADLQEKPYADLTLNWLKRLGIGIMHTHAPGVDTYKIQGRQQYQPFDYTLPGDFSSASYLLAAGALFPGEIMVTGLDLQDPQGDKRLIDILRSMGANIHTHHEGIRVIGGSELRGLSIDANDIPDLLPTLAVLGTQAQGRTEIKNVAHARIKETDRIHAMTTGLRRMGAHVEEQADGLVIYQSDLRGATINGFGDHRTVMAMTLAGMLATGETRISDAGAIAKTYPNYISDLCTLGADVEVIHD